MDEQIVIAGAGHAAGQLLAVLKQQNYAGRIVVVGEEKQLPYQRPPLSKKYLTGEFPVERLLFKPRAFYSGLDIDFRLGTRVMGIDREAREVVCNDDRRTAFDTLFLATGGSVRRLTVPGSELAGIHYLRNIADADALRHSITNASRVVVVGAGYIGLEVAAVAATLGADVTVVENADRVMSRVVSPALSAFFEAEHRAKGVSFELGAAIEQFVGDNRVEALRMADGRSLCADAVIVGIGIEPNVGIAADAGLDVDNGIVTDDRCRTSDADIFAVGDCNAHPSAVYGRRIRLESVQNALEQARIAVVNACGGNEIYDEVPWFWSDQYDLKLQIAGLSDGYDDAIVRGDPAGRSFSVAYLREGRLIALDAVNAPRDFVQSKTLIRNQVEPDRGLLADASAPLKDLS